jgi:hypothetical protein
MTVLFTALRLRARMKHRRELEGAESLTVERRANIDSFVR